jgi:hypothetical protein
VQQVFWILSERFSGVLAAPLNADLGRHGFRFIVRPFPVREHDNAFFSLGFPAGATAAHP